MCQRQNSMMLVAHMEQKLSGMLNMREAECHVGIPKSRSRSETCDCAPGLEQRQRMTGGGGAESRRGETGKLSAMTVFNRPITNIVSQRRCSQLSR
jgi:hypothetical protein